MFKLKLKNFRGFIDEEFDFSRINILIGENSSGKSSIFKFLLSLKQSLRSPQNKEVNIAFSGIDTDLGNFNEAIYNHEVNRSLIFSFEFDNKYTQFFFEDAVGVPKGTDSKTTSTLEDKRSEISSYIGEEIGTTVVEFHLTKDIYNHQSIKTYIKNDRLGSLSILHDYQSESNPEQEIYLIGDSPICKIRFDSKDFERTFELSEIDYRKEAFLTIIVGDSLKTKIRQSDGFNDVEKLFWQIGYLLMTQNYIQLLLSQMEYINPLISKPAERVYVDGDARSTQRIGDIKELVDYISRGKQGEFRTQLSKIITEMGIANDVYIKKEENGFTRELRVVLNDLDSNIKDVGFGVSLQLPIFAQALISEKTRRMKRGVEIMKGETLLIEQPEVHLHPRLQAKFIDLLLQIGNNNIYFIETHSEHIIRMLQVLIKERKYNLKATDVAIYYLRKEGKATINSSHKIDSTSGKLIPHFPKGFYDLSYNLAFKLMD